MERSITFLPTGKGNVSMWPQGKSAHWWQPSIPFGAVQALIGQTRQ
jgi:hypothetical protein